MAVIYYTESTPVTASSGNVAANTATATLPAVPGKTTYITGFTITGGGATAGSIVNATVTNVVGGTMTFNFAAPTGAAVGASPLGVTFPLPIPANAVNTTVVVSVPSLGAGNTNASVVAYGYQK